MPKKKQPRNAFFFFMLDYKARCERNGERFPNGLKDVQTEAGPEWDVLSPAAKKPYEDMAKEEKAKAKGNMAYKETSLHNSFYSIDKQKLEEEEALKTMNTFIENLMWSLSSTKSLAEHKFYLIHVNYFCISDGECYHPAELAVCEFSLQAGVSNVYHVIIDPGLIPLGYRHDAMQKAEKTHKIPVENKDGENDFCKILMNIKKFLEPGRAANGGKYPPMYTMSDNVNLNTSMSAIKSVMGTLCSALGDRNYEDPDNYPIYSLEKLFYELENTSSSFARRSGADDEDNDQNCFPSINFARIELEKDVFNYTPNIACVFHNKQDNVEYCSKSYVQRWVYLICDHCCQDLAIDIIAGQHVPENVDQHYRQNKLAEGQQKKEEPPSFSWVDHSKPAQPKYNWVPVENPPLTRPAKKGSLAEMLAPRKTEPMSSPQQAPELPPPRQAPEVPPPRQAPEIAMNENNFPMMGRGMSSRGRQGPPGTTRGRGPLSFAQATRK